ncbi:hypothetical protein CLIB1423_16S01816 [[Candida] railenensis]|uniref:Ubiquitin carboxyl-terminal hydrolase n=1 Tax=[Candida] railenensis TaxID=45579 RepID=A0A9P0QT18_9ASCO|nr:hypothetical protein CLIB1423_16S01816 [[Candida] railenensis]
MTVSPPPDSLPYGDGSNKVYGMENFGNTCYCNSILQCLYYTDSFRTHLASHNDSSHNRRLTFPGIKQHGFTAKYETLMAKKVKQTKSGSSSSGNGVGPTAQSSNGHSVPNGSNNSANNGGGSHSDRTAGANGSIVSGSSTGSNPTVNSGPSAPSSVSSAGSQPTSGTHGLPPPPSSSSSSASNNPATKRSSIFGIKFNYSLGSSSNNNSNNNNNNNNAQNGWDALKKNSISDAQHCEELSVEQQILIKKNPDFQNLSILVTRPPKQTFQDKMDYSQASSMLLGKDSGNNNNGKDKDAQGCGAGASPGGTTSFVIVGIPHPDPLTAYNPNPTSDQRKRAALINGPIINLDCSFQLPSQQHEQTALLYSLRDMFQSMIENKSQIGVVSPNWFISKLKEKNYLFRQNNMHHDAHEFCNYLINDIIECIDQENLENGSENTNGGNWCNDIFKGSIANETKCLSCETITSKEESFLDLSVDIPPGESSYSLTHSLNNFSKSERLTHQNKFYCNTCSSLQEATKTIKIKKIPEVLVINFKRFKYDEKVDRMVKLFDSISYSHNLRLFNTKEEESSKDQQHNNNASGSHYGNGDDFALFELYALVVHIGGGPMHGHYVALCKVKAKLWLLFDDETVELVDDSYVMRFFGDGPGLASAYILFYRRCRTEAGNLVDNGKESEPSDEDIDFGFNLDEIYHGGDYSLAGSSKVNPQQSRQISVGSDGIHDETAGGKLSTASSSFSTSDTLDGGQNFAGKDVPISKKATGLFKKNFKLDNFTEEVTSSVSRTSSIGGEIKNPSPPLAKSNEKKSWVGGLKRRESKQEGLSGKSQTAERNNSVVSESSNEGVARRKSIFGFKKKK